MRPGSIWLRYLSAKVDSILDEPAVEKTEQQGIRRLHIDAQTVTFR
jgi:hypothetical protein